MDLVLTILSFILPCPIFYILCNPTLESYRVSELIYNNVEGFLYWKYSYFSYYLSLLGQIVWYGHRESIHWEEFVH